MYMSAQSHVLCPCHDFLRMGDWDGLRSFALVLQRRCDETFHVQRVPVRVRLSLSLLTSFEETRGIVLLRTALSVGCIQQRKALSTLRGRERGEEAPPATLVRLERRNQHKGERGRKKMLPQAAFVRASDNVAVEAIGVPPGHLVCFCHFSIISVVAANREKGKIFESTNNLF